MVIASDMMEGNVVCVGVDDRLSSVCRLFYEEDITGAPVLSDQGKVVGVVSMRDLIRTLQEDREALVGMPSYYRDTRSSIRPDWLADTDDLEERLAHRLVSEIMTPEVVSVDPDDDISTVAQKILEHQIHRVLVIDDESEEDKLLGLISVFDLVTLLK
jgi:CBS domain-containing protein